MHTTSLREAHIPARQPTTHRYRTDARNRVTTYTADALERITGWLYQDATRVTLTFDAAGRQLILQDFTGITSYQYDAASRRTSVLYPTAKALTYSFDPVGNRSLLLDADAGRTTYTFDSRNLAIGIVNPFAERTTVSYDALGRELQKTLGNGVVASHSYDAAGREVGLWNVTAAGATQARYTTTFDAVGNPLAIQEAIAQQGSVSTLAAGNVTFGYDALYQLLNEQRSGANAYNTTYQYDGVGNRLLKNDSGARTTYSYNLANALLVTQPPTGARTTVTWDAAGNLLGENTGGALTTYTWDDENRMTAVTYPSAAIETHTYSADGRRVQKYDSILGTLQYLWDEWNLLREELVGVDVLRFTDWPGAWGGLVSNHQGTGSFFYGFDALEDTRLLAGSNATVQDLYTFRAFGETVQTAGSDRNPYQYGGQWGYYTEESPAVSRLYVRMRQLRVDQGRWMSRDPLGASGDWNLYRYAGNSPTFFTDPAGLLKMNVGVGTGTVNRPLLIPPTPPATPGVKLLPYWPPTLTPSQIHTVEGVAHGAVEVIEVPFRTALQTALLGVTLFFEATGPAGNPIDDSLSIIVGYKRLARRESGYSEKHARCLAIKFYNKDLNCITIWNRGGPVRLLRIIKKYLMVTNPKGDPRCNPKQLEIHHMPQAAYIKTVCDPRDPTGKRKINPDWDAPAEGMLKKDHEKTRSWKRRPNFVDPPGTTANVRQVNDVKDLEAKFPNQYLSGAAEMRGYAIARYSPLFKWTPEDDTIFPKDVTKGWRKKKKSTKETTGDPCAGL